MKGQNCTRTMGARVVIWSPCSVLSNAAGHAAAQPALRCDTTDSLRISLHCLSASFGAVQASRALSCGSVALYGACFTPECNRAQSGCHTPCKAPRVAPQSLGSCCYTSAARSICSLHDKEQEAKTPDHASRPPLQDPPKRNTAFRDFGWCEKW